MVDESLRNYIETSILPLYDGFDAAHRRDHVDISTRNTAQAATSGFGSTTVPTPPEFKPSARLSKTKNFSKKNSIICMMH